MTYYPPFAKSSRRAIVQRPALPKAEPVAMPANVDEALATMPELEPVVVEEPVVEEPVVEEPIVVAEEEPVVEPEVIAEPEPVVESKPEPVVLPKWDSKMRKSDLLKIALDAGLALTEENTKAQIIEALVNL